MEPPSFHLQALIGFGILVTILWLGLLMAKANKKVTPPPEAAGARPLIGHLHLLRPNMLLHKTLGAMADKYGPAFSIRLGIQKALVVSNWEVAKECFTTNDKVFSSRPRSLALKLMAYDHAVLGFAPYGPYWRNLRKVVVIELLSSHRLEMLKHVWDSEINIFMKEMYEKWIGDGGKNPVLVDMKEKFGDLAMNIVLRIVAGKRYAGRQNEESRRFQKALGKFSLLTGVRMVSDAIPFLGWLDVLNGYRGEMKRSAREVDDLLGGWVEEHRRKRLTGRINEGERDFMDVMISVMEEQEGENRSLPLDTDTVIKATCLSMILGGNETTGITLMWALSLLLNNRHVLQKAQDELDFHVGKHRQVDESDTTNLVYLQAIVKETLRLYPTVPLLIPHQAMEDCTVAGFHVPAGTHLLVNLWKLHQDPSIWAHPFEFQPERFLTDQGAKLEVRGQNFELIPFGSGRRICPGITFALRVLNLMLARLLHGFELGTVLDLQVDMTECPGLTIPKATPMEVLLTPRLSSELYNC